MFYWWKFLEFRIRNNFGTTRSLTVQIWGRIFLEISYTVKNSVPHEILNLEFSLSDENCL